MRKIFTFVAATLMAAAMFAAPRTFESGEALYLNAGAVSWWQDANAAQVATFFDGTENHKVVGEPANDPTKVKFVVPAGSYYTVVFSRHENADLPAWNSTGAISLEGTTENMVNSFEQNSTEATWAHYDGGGIDVPTCPSMLSVIGNIEGIGWVPSKAAELNKSGNTFTGTFTFVPDGTNEICYFCFLSVKLDEDDWTTANANRFGTKGTIAVDGDAVALDYPGEKTATIAPGTYTISVDWDTMSVTAVVPTALPNVEDNHATKMIENGQLVIIKNGVRYNVAGAQF